ncbi:MAG: type II toxin-antitoxin system RelE/ParE family toxin [Alphaproteobacteria bacterium]|nr:type II toxin-antitoxin system RelE/ParE family toxin [Alphaproteobacteria bacterium]
MKELVVADSARRDLREISRYTIEQWGDAQRRQYLLTLRQCLFRLRENTGAARRRDDVAGGLRSLDCGRHVIFFRETGTSILVLRVLHQRMDVRSRLPEE